MSTDGVMRVPGAALLAALLLLGLLVFAAIALAGDDPPTPVISGDPRVGETLTASAAAVYKWQRCDPVADPCASDGGQNASGWQNVSAEGTEDAASYTPILADLGMMIRVLAKDTSLGTKFAASAPVGPVAPAFEEPQPPPQQTTQPPPQQTTEPPQQTTQPPQQTTQPPQQTTEPPPNPPAFRRTGDLNPLAGTVLAKLPGSNQWVEIGELTQVPLGTKVDVSYGRVELVTQKKPSGGLQSIELWAGAFVVTQNRKRNITVLGLANSLPAPSLSRAGAQAAGKRKRRLWGRGKCRCRHKGRNSSGTARGTWWLTVERPKGTLTKVKKGKVVVRDFKRRKNVLVKSGQRYLARR